MKEVAYRSGIREAAGLRTLAEQATKSLEEMLGRESPTVSAEWDRAEDARGQDVVTLRLSDWTGSATAAFEPKELESPTRLERRLRRVWGELLRIRSHKLLDDLLSSGNGEEGGGDGR